jgi:hypothetical protein
LEKTEKEEPQSGNRVSGPRFEPGSSLTSTQLILEQLNKQHILKAAGEAKERST